MIGKDHTLTSGHVSRHIPPASRVGVDIALLDIAQDFLLAHLCERQVIGGLVVFKGGTALRKLYAGTTGRFSTDMDFASLEAHENRVDLADVIAEECQVTLGPFQFEPTNARGRWRIRVSSPFGNPTVTIKIDIRTSLLASTRCETRSIRAYPWPVRIFHASHHFHASGGNSCGENRPPDACFNGKGRVRPGVGQPQHLRTPDSQTQSCDTLQFSKSG